MVTSSSSEDTGPIEESVNTLDCFLQGHENENTVTEVYL